MKLKELLSLCNFKWIELVTPDAAFKSFHRDEITEEDAERIIKHFSFYRAGGIVIMSCDLA